MRRARTARHAGRWLGYARRVGARSARDVRGLRRHSAAADPGTSGQFHATITQHAPFTDAVTITATSLPAGVTAESITIAPGETTGVLELRDIGDGKVACAEGERDLGRVNQGIEGAVCCAPAATTP